MPVFAYLDCSNQPFPSQQTEILSTIRRQLRSLSQTQKLFLLVSRFDCAEIKIQRFLNAATHEIHKRRQISSISLSQCVIIPSTIIVSNNRERITLPNQKQIHQQPRHSPIPVVKRMNRNKPVMKNSRNLNRTQLLRVLPQPFKQLLNQSGHFKSRRRQIIRTLNKNLRPPKTSRILQNTRKNHPMKLQNVIFRQLTVFQTFNIRNRSGMITRLKMITNALAANGRSFPDNKLSFTQSQPITFNSIRMIRELNLQSFPKLPNLLTRKRTMTI